MSELSELLKQVQDPYMDLQVYGPTPPERHYTGVLTLYKGQDAIFTLTLTRPTFQAAANRIQVMLLEVLGSELKGQRRLPSSGDEVIRYW